MMQQQLFNSAPCGYFSFFDDGNFVTANETLYNLTGYTQEELSGKNINTIFTLPTRIFCQTHLFPMLKLHGMAEEIFLTLLTKNKQHLPVLLNAKKQEWEGRTIMACAFIVVANRKKFEDELVAARNTAESALKENSELIKAKLELQRYSEKLDRQVQIVNRQNSELRQFNHVITHNLKEPLRKILLYADRLQANAPAPLIQKDVAKVEKAAGQLKNVVEGLQQYVWLNESAPDFTTVELSQIVHKAVKQLDAEDPGKLSEIQMNELPVIEANANQLQLLFYHLLQNAIKFKKQDKANVTINATLLKRNWFRTVEDKYRYEDFVKIDVRDEGFGFDPAYKDSLFQIFHKLHYGEGLGLGLALCRMIVNNHAGSIEADSKLNEFSLFTIWLPLKQTGLDD